MNYLSTDYLIVYAFLAITLFIGLRAGRGIKDIREYALANKSFGTGALVLTYLATHIAGASVVNMAGEVFSEGIIMVVSLLSIGISFCIMGIFIAPKIAQFDQCLSLGDLTKEFYGTRSGLIAGFLGVLNAVLLVGMELGVLGIMCETLLRIPAKWGITGGGVMLSIYSAHGGIKAVTKTDIFQFIMVAFFVPLIAYIAVGKIGGIPALLQQVPTQKLEVFSHKDFSFYLTLFLMWLIPSGIVEDPALLQRLLMAKRGKQLRDQYLIVAAVDPFFQIVIMLIALSAAVLYPQIEGKQVVSHLIHELLPVGLKGLAMAGVLAVGMSTIDSYLHAAGLTLAHDVIKPICDQNNIKINELRWARYMTVLVGVVGIGIGLEAKDILGLAFSALEFVSPLLMFPLLSGIMGLKTDQRSFYTALVVTLLAFIAAKLSLSENKAHFSVLITMAANGLTFFGMHALKNKGFAKVRVIQPTLELSTIWRPRQQTILQKIKQMLPNPSGIFQYSNRKVTQYGAPYVLFGVFLVINYAVPFFMWAPTLPQYASFMIYLRFIGGILCILLSVEEKWPEKLRLYMPSFFHLTVLYCLPFLNTVLLLINQGSIESLASIAASILFMIVLVDWMSMILLTTLGVGLGYLWAYLVIKDISFGISFSIQYLLVYQLFFITMIGLLFARRKSKINTVREQQEDILAGSVLKLHMEFAIQATKRLASHVAFYTKNTHDTWNKSSIDGFQTLVVHGMQTIEDPTLYKLLKQISPTLWKLNQRAEEAIQLLNSTIKSKTIAANLHLEYIKTCVTDTVVEFKLIYPTYECMIYQLVYTEPVKPILKIIKLRLCEAHLLITDYSDLFPREAFLPLIRGIASREGQSNVNFNKSYLELVQNRIKSSYYGYQEFKLPFPKMEIAA